MNCAKCSSPGRGNRIPKFIALRSTGDIWRGEGKFKCPNCGAIFWFPIPRIALPDANQQRICR